MLPNADMEALPNWFQYADDVQQAGSCTATDYLDEVYVAFNLAQKHYGSDAAQQIFDAGKKFTFNSFEIQAAAEMVQNGAEMGKVFQAALDGACDCADRDYYESRKALEEFRRTGAISEHSGILHIILSTGHGDSQELNLPLKIEDVLRQPIPYFLAYGKADIEFQTPSCELRDVLKRSMPDALENGIRELNLLATALDQMNGQQLLQLENSLVSEKCDYAEVTRRILYVGYEAFYKSGAPNPNAQPLEQYDATSCHRHLEEKINASIQKELECLRLTGGQLFEKVMDCARQNGDLERFDAICDYSLPETYEQSKLCSYEFDLLPAVNFGGSEGIYIDCSLRGKFDETDRTALRIGTIKTLETDLDACKTMGELCGTLLYHESKFVNENLYLFAPTQEVEHLLSRKLTVSNQSLEVDQKQKPVADMQMS